MCGVRPRRTRSRFIGLLAWLPALWACSEPTPDEQAATTGAGGLVGLSAPPDGSSGLALPPPRPKTTNPLGLPAGQTEAVAPGARVFAVPEAMLKQAQLGSSLALHAATFVERAGGDYVVKARGSAPYAIHPGYVVVPRPGRFRRGGAVFAAYRGRLHHGVVKGLFRKKVVVRFTDLGFKLGDQRLKPRRIGVLRPGLQPGGNAVVSDSEGRLHHLLLVSAAAHPDGKRRWLVLRYAGQAELIDEAELQPLPVARLRPKVGKPLLAAWRGEMVPVQLRAIDRPSLYTVQRPRLAGRMVVGPSMVMPLRDAKSGAR